MKKVFLSISILFLLLLCGCGTGNCDTNSDYNVEIIVDTHYVDISQQIKVNTYNSYQSSGYEVVENPDGTYDVYIHIIPPNRTRG